MKNLLIPIVGVMLLVSCSTEKEVVPSPEAKLGDDVPAEIKLGVYDEMVILNKSANAKSYLWNFGDGRTSTETNAVLKYPAAGIYTLSLKATTDDGQESTITRTVKVYDFVLKSVTVKNLYLNLFDGKDYAPADVLFPHFSTVDLWVEIKLGSEGQEYSFSPAGDKEMPVLWKSPVVSYTEGGDAQPLHFAIPGIAVDVPALGTRAGAGWGYGFNIYAKDASGTYLLGSTYWSGSFAGIDHVPANDSFTLRTGQIICEMDFQGTMELP
jgi:hypothetical protein